MNLTFPFSLIALPYQSNELEPHIKNEIIDVHYNYFMKSYVDKLNNTIKNYPELHNWTLEKLLTYLPLIPPAIQQSIKRFAGGVYNHQLYFESMTSSSNSKLSNTFSTIIENNFGSIENFQNAFTNAAMAIFGSGYAWLVLTPSNDLSIIMTKNQDNPFTLGLTPLLCIDAWEHAYTVQYINKRKEYIDSWFSIVNWNHVEELYNKAIQK